MAAINGTAVVLYSNGQPVAMQKGLSVSFNNSIIDGSNKESLGWYEGMPGQKDAKIDFSALFGTGLMTDNPKVLSATDLITQLSARSSLLVSILDFGVPIVGEVFQDSLTFDAPNEGAMSLSGSFKVNGPLYALTGSMANLITDPDGGSNSYDTMTVSGLAITSAITAAGNCAVTSNVISVATTGVYKFAVFLTVTGQVPTVGIWDNTGSFISNQVALVAGLNIVTLTATATDASSSLRIINTSAANWSMGNLSLFRVA
jgi:predicted secreted protein